MFLEMTAKESIKFAQRRLFLRFCGTIVICFAFIMFGVGFIMASQLDSEQKKILNSIAAEYQRILGVHGGEKLRFIASNNPQQLIEHDMTLLQTSRAAELKWSTGSHFSTFNLALENYQWKDQFWYQIFSSPNLLSLLISDAQEDFWLVVNLDQQLNGLYQRWQWIGIALALLCFLISIVVWRLISSTLFPLNRLAIVVDQTKDWSMDSLDKISEQQLSVSPKGLEILNASVNLLLGRLVSTIHSMEATVDAIAHDLRTPLTRINLTAEKHLSNSTSKTEVSELENALSDCAESAHQAGQMLTTLMGIHEEVMGTHAIQLESIDLGEFIDKVLSWYREFAEDKGIIIEIDALESSQLKTDIGRLNQVLVNLIDNAIKFNHEGGKVILKSGALDENSVYFDIIDSGVGIDPKHHELIFKRLYRVDSSRSNAGYGLGLAQVKTIVETLKGKIELKSAVGEGCHIRISLPTNYSE